MAALRVLPPREYVGATEAIPEVVELVEKLLASGAAYVVDDEYPDIYYRADATPQFGYESGYDRETMLRLFERARRRPAPARQDRPTRRAAVAGRAATASPVGRRRSVRAGRAGTSNARRSR